jgi:hypothetical protein
MNCSNQLLKGKIGKFSLDALVNMATRAGIRVGLTIKPMPRVTAAESVLTKKPVAAKHGTGRRAA